MNSLVIRILTLATLFCMVAVCANAAAQSPTATDAALHRAIIHVLGKEYLGELRFASRGADLNGDGRSEILVWVPTIGYGGTSGYPLLIFQRGRHGYRLVSAIEQVWTPLVVLRSTRRGWRDIVMQEGGGGAEMRYILLRYDGRSYAKPDNSSLSEAMIARGRILIGRDWNATTFGPIPR